MNPGLRYRCHSIHCTTRWTLKWSLSQARGGDAIVMPGQEGKTDGRWRGDCIPVCGVKDVGAVS